MRPVVKRIMEGASADKFKKIAYCLAIFLGMYAVNTSGPSYSVSMLPSAAIRSRIEVRNQGPTHPCS